MRQQEYYGTEITVLKFSGRITLLEHSSADFSVMSSLYNVTKNKTAQIQVLQCDTICAAFVTREIRGGQSH